jgi:hypothetical protein
MRKVIKTVEVTFDEVQAFHTLCEVLGIDTVVLSEEQLYIHKGKVCRKDKNGDFEVVDDRADLFAALRNVAVAYWANCEFRSDPYITNWGYECPSNGDMVRRMSDKELADFLGKFEDCRDDIFEWLISDAETEEEEP